MTTQLSHSKRIASDPVYAALVANRDQLGSELDAAFDGALHYAYGHRADTMVDKLHDDYTMVCRVLNEYRNGNGQATSTSALFDSLVTR